MEPLVLAEALIWSVAELHLASVPSGSASTCVKCFISPAHGGRLPF